VEIKCGQSRETGNKAYTRHIYKYILQETGNISFALQFLHDSTLTQIRDTDSTLTQLRDTDST
jgi:predicted nucleic acid-binding Zn ribbon protein